VFTFGLINFFQVLCHYNFPPAHSLQHNRHQKFVPLGNEKTHTKTVVHILVRRKKRHEVKSTHDATTPHKHKQVNLVDKWQLWESTLKFVVKGKLTNCNKHNYQKSQINKNLI
jgi:hypothetical protein